MHVPPSSGDCGPGLDPSAPVMASRRSLNRWQHPKVIENSSRHEPTRLTTSANGSRANRADEQMSGRASGAMRLHRANLPFPRHPLCSIEATRQGFPSARLLPPVAALGLDGARLRCGADFRDEGMAGLVIPLEENQNAVFP
jgi:hypothetical protein